MSARTRAVGHADREMHDRPGRFADTGGVLDADAAELADQDVLHLQPDVGGVAVAGQIDQTRHEVGERSARRNSSVRRREPRSTTALAMSSSSWAAQREQLGARNGLDDVEQQLAGMARVALRQRQTPRRTRREISGISSTLALMAATVNRPTKRCSMADRRRELLADHDDVGVGAVAQVARDGGLSQHQQVVVVRSAAAAHPGAAAARRAGWPGRRMPRPSLTGQRWYPSSTKCPSASQRRSAATSLRSRPGNRPRGRRRVRAPARALSPPSRRESSATCRASASTPGSSCATSASALLSAACASWTWIQDSSTPSRDAAASAGGRMSQQLAAGLRRTRKTGFMIAV